MSNPKITGATKVVQAKTTGFNVQTGYFEKIVTDFAGPGAEANAQALGRSMCLLGYNWTCTTLGGGAFRLEQTSEQASPGSGSGSNISDPNTPLNDIWELQPNLVEKDLLDTDVSTINALTSAEKKAITDAVSKEGDTTLTGTSLTLYKLLVAGVKTRRVYAPTLRHTRLVRKDYSITDSLRNVGNILTTAQLYSLEKVPKILLFGLPSGTTPTRADGLSLGYGWYKKPPTITQVSGGKWQLVQEWEYGLWSTDIYTGAS